jgi:hypothetical protein
MVKTATRADTDKCVALIALAFSNDPAARWAYKDPAAYLEHFPAFARAFSCAAFDYGTAHHIEGSATALWIPPGVEPDEGPLVALIEASVPAGDLAAVLDVLEQMGEAHPQEPHWYLPLIGTDPAQQVTGRRFSGTHLRSSMPIGVLLISKRRARGTWRSTRGTASKSPVRSRPETRRQSRRWCGGPAKPPSSADCAR